MDDLIAHLVSCEGGAIKEVQGQFRENWWRFLYGTHKHWCCAKVESCFFPHQEVGLIWCPKPSSFSKITDKYFKAKFRTAEGEQILKIDSGIHGPKIGSGPAINSVHLIDMNEIRSRNVM